MAVNKTINGITNNSQWTYKLEVNEIETSIQNNTSTLQIKVYIGRASSQSYLGGNYSVSVTCDNQVQSQNGNISYPTYINGGAWLELKTFTFIVPHNSDGTKTANISSTLNSGDFTPSYANANGSITLTALHTPPILVLSNLTEISNKLSGVEGTTFVNNISEKVFTLSYELFDDATASLLKIYDKNGNELTATTVLNTTSGTITVNFKNVPISSNTIVNNKTTFIIKFIDSLNGETIINTPEYTVIPYFAPNLISTASNVKRNGQITGKAVLNLTGLFYNATIGNTVNSITLSFAYWTGSTESTTYYSIPSSANTGTGNDITISRWEFKKNNVTVTDLDKSNSYKFKIKAVDSFGSEYESIIELTLSKGEWLMARFKDRVDFKKITVGGYNPFEYSTTETICGVWEDGKPIYGKYVPLLVSTLNTNWANGIDITGLNIDTLVDCVTFGIGNKSKLCKQGGVYFQIEGNYIQLVTWSTFTGFQNAWIQYTKTTD